MKVINPIDKLITEWSWRCKKGYPDLNNPEDMAILKEILHQYDITLEEVEERIEEQEEITVNDLIDLIKSKGDALDKEFISRIYGTIKNKGKGLSTSIKNTLEKRGVEKATGLILTAAQRQGIEEKLTQYLNSPESEKFGLSDLRSGSGGDFVEFLANKTKLPTSFLKTIADVDTPISSKGVGKAEYALALLGREGLKLKIGDVEIEGKSIEVKADKARLGERSDDLSNLYSKIEDTFGIPPGLVKGKPENLLSYINRVSSKLEDKKSLDVLRNLVSKEFDGYLSNIDIKSTPEVEKAALSWYVDTFFKTEPSDLILVYLNGKFKVYTKEEFKNDVLNNKFKYKQTFSRSNKAPQLLDFA